MPVWAKAAQATAAKAAHADVAPPMGFIQSAIVFLSGNQDPSFARAMADVAEQLAYYRAQLALLSRDKNPGADVAALRNNLREMIQMLAEEAEGGRQGSAVAPQAKPNSEIFESLTEDKEQEDVVSSDDDMFSDTSWDVKQAKERKKREALEKAAAEASAAEELERKKVQFVSAGALDPNDLRREMNVERQRQPRKRDDDEAGASAKQTQKLEDDVLAARKEEVMSRVRRLEQEAGHGVEGKWGESEGAVAVAAASVEGGGTWAELSDSDDRGQRSEAEDEMRLGRDDGSCSEEEGGCDSDRRVSAGGMLMDHDDFLYKERTWTQIYKRPIALTGQKMLGAWEQHTRGVATNIMRRMGYVQGAGLGPGGEGIMNPLVAKAKNDKTGLGADPEGQAGMEEEEGEGAGKRKRGGAKKWTSEKQRLRAEETDHLTKKKGWEATDDSGIVATMNSSVMSGSMHVLSCTTALGPHSNPLTPERQICSQDTARPWVAQILTR